MNSQASASDNAFWADTNDELARRRHRELLDALDEGIYQLNGDGEFLAVNEAFVRSTGYTRAELLGEHVSLLLGPEDVERLQREVKRAHASRHTVPLELTICRASGEKLPCVVRLKVSLEDGDFEGLLGIVSPTPGTPQREQARAANQELLQTIIDESDGAAIVLDESFEVVWADPAIGQYFGVDSKDIVGRDKRLVVQEWKMVVEDSDSFAKRILAAYGDNSYVEEFECHIMPGDDREERWLEHLSTPIKSGKYEGGRIEYYTDISEWKQSANALKQSEEEFSSLVDAVKEYAIFRLDSDGRVRSWNKGAKAIKGYEREEILGEHISTFYSEADQAAGLPQENLEVATEAGSVEDEGWRIRKDGSKFWAKVTITTLHDEDGSHQGYLKVTRDLTERHKQEQELQNELHNILDRVSDGFVGLDDEFRFTYVNDRAAELIEVDPEEARGRSIWEVFPKAVDSPFEEQYQRAMREQVSVSFEEYFAPLDMWFAVSAYPSETGLSVYFRDVTERRERQEALREREQELREYRAYTDDILNSLDDLFYVVDREGTYQRWNESLRSVTGYSDEEIKTMDPLEFIVEEDRERLARGIENIFQTGQSRVEAGILTKTGQRVPMEFAASVVKTPSGERVAAGIGRDITERKARQQLLEESNERLEQFAYAASHDLQEPLRMVSSYLQLIEGRYADVLDEEGQEFLEFAVDGADRMRDMIDGLLEYSRIESEGVSFQPVELDDVLADVLDSLQLRCEECDADISVGDLPRIEGDRGQMRQLFQNLLDNAMTYSGDGPPQITVSAEAEDEEWILSVSDEGVGIDPDDAGRIFDVFQSLDAPGDQGSGIGLALCKRIVERHGGDIWVDSTLGDGATFSFTVPSAGDQ